jgi:hypothetical protein
MQEGKKTIQTPMQALQRLQVSFWNRFDGLKTDYPLQPDSETPSPVPPGRIGLISTAPVSSRRPSGGPL